MLSFRRKSLIGVDIDTCAVRMIQLQRDDGGTNAPTRRGGSHRDMRDGAPPGRYTVTGACLSEIPPWGENPELRKVHTVRAIRQGLGGGDIQGKLAVCGLRGHEVVVRGFEFPVLAAEEIAGAVALEASQICPFSTDESTLDYQVTSTDVRRTRGFWVAANNSLIRSTGQLVREAGLYCSLIDVDGLALLNCLQVCGERTSPADRSPPPTILDAGSLRPVAVLDVGGSCSTVAIRDQAGRPFVRDIGSGSDEILRRMAVEARVPLETARAALLNYGLEPSIVASLEFDVSDQDPARDTPHSQAVVHANDENRLWNGLEGACAELLEDVGTTLRYHAAQSSCARAEKLLVCGTLAMVDEFIELLHAKLYIDVSPWNPLAAMRCEAGEECQALLREAGPSMALAAGLAMRQL